MTGLYRKEISARRHPRAGRLVKLAACAAFLAAFGCSSTPRMAGDMRVFSANMESRKMKTWVRVHGTRAPVTVLLDEYAIPYVTGSSDADLAFAMGYLHARERRFQMELFRMTALGRLREILGGEVPPAILRIEMASRMIGFSAEAAELFAGLGDEDRGMLESYADGVNEATKKERRPIEFALLDYDPEPWNPVDTLSILAMISFGFCKNWEQELSRLELMVYQLRTGSTIPRALGIWPARFDLPPHLVGVKPASDPFAGVPEVSAELAEYLETKFAGKAQLAETGRETVPSTPFDDLAKILNPVMSSNNWAVDGIWTATGKSALALDPHFPISLPPLVYIAALKLDAADGRGYEVMGAGIPGLPALPFGTNGKVAWGPTSNWADVADLYVEKQVEERPGSYLTEGGEEPFTVRDEVFKVRTSRGYAREKKTVRVSRHGVIVNDFLDRLPADFPLVALRRAQTFGQTLRSLGLLYRAGSVSEARAALEGFTAMVGNWALADSLGSIGYAGPVNLPVRKGFLGTVPVPGWNGKYEWQGSVPAGSLPGIQNPEAHYLATANNQVVQPESLGYPINFEGDVPHRVGRILEKLSAGNADGQTAAIFRSIQMDGTDPGFLAAKPALAGALDTLRRDADARVAKAAALLADWDGRVDPDSPVPTIYQSFISHLMIELLSDEVPPETLKFLLFYFNVDPLLFGIISDPANPAWDIRGTAGIEDAMELQLLAFRKTARALTKAYGGRVDNWRWKKAAPLSFSHPFGSAISILNRSGFPPRGTGSSVYMHKYDRSDPVRFPVSYGPVLRIVVDFADPSSSTISIPGGQSGRPFSRNYDDILPLFMRGDGVAMELDFNAVEARGARRIELVPDGVTAE